MNWEAIAAIGEAVGAAGVIATLFYLALQIRASTRASAVESKLTSARFQLEFYTLLVQFPDLQEIMIDGCSDLSSLSPAKYHRFSNLMFIAFHSFSAAHFQFRNGSVSESDFLENLMGIRYMLRSPGGRQWWEKIGKHNYGPEFVAVIDAEMREADAA